MEGAAAVGVVASASNALVTLCKNIFQYVEIPGEVEQFKLAIQNLEDSINTTKRLRRVKSGILDQATKDEVDVSIERSEKVLDGICRYIEGCRVDLQTRGSISTKNKLDWMLRGHQSFMARGMTLTGCIQNLSMHAVRMEAHNQSESLSSAQETQITQSLPMCGNCCLPPYSENLPSPEKFLRAPTARKRRSRVFSTSSQTSLDIEHNKASTLGGMAFSDEKEVIVGSRSSLGSDTETSSIFSFEDDQPMARILSVTNLNCGGDYCTNEFCANHAYTYQKNVLIQTKSLDSGTISDGRDSAYRTLSTSSTSSHPVISSSQRRRHKSGFV